MLVDERLPAGGDHEYDAFGLDRLVRKVESAVLPAQLVDVGARRGSGDGFGDFAANLRVALQVLFVADQDGDARGGAWAG